MNTNFVRKKTLLSVIAKHLDVFCKKHVLIQGFAIDSRHIKEGEVFFALPGKKADGHQFLQEASHKKAFAAVVNKEYKGPNFGLTLLPVENVEIALQELAAIAFSSRKEKVIAITGSMGKTTTKEFLSILLSSRYRVAKTENSQNTKLTVPLRILNLDEEYDVIILEMGMSLKGEIARLVQLFPPQAAIVTRIAPASMEFFENGLLGVAKAKAEIFSHSKTKWGLISSQAAQYEAVFQGGSIPKYIYGWQQDFSKENKGDYLLKKTQNGLIFAEKTGFESPCFQLCFTATHLSENFLAAAAMARKFSLSWEEISSKIPFLNPFTYRFQIFEREGVTFIQDCYNANPDSMRAAFNNLPLPKKNGHRIGVLGSMPDIGKETEKYHREIGNLALIFFDQIFTLGNEAKIFSEIFIQERKKATHFCTIEEIKKTLFEEIQFGDVVLIKGANSLQMWKIFE